MSDAKLTARRMLPAGLMLVAATALTGCMGPTYGTGTPSDQQLLEDVSGILTLGGERDAPIAYQPRGELVRPGSTAVLPQPQQSATSGQAWPESPEQRLARIREDATVNQDNVQANAGARGSRSGPSEMRPSPRSNEIDTTLDGRTSGTSRAQREEFNQRLAQSQQGDPNQRRFLSEPPPAFRQPAASAPVGDVGEDEWRKERAAKQAQGKTSWRDYIPGL